MARRCATCKVESQAMDGGCDREGYIRQVLEAYRKTPGTTGTVRHPDRVLAAQLVQRGVSVRVIENAFVLAATRRLIRLANAPPLGTIRSLGLFPAGHPGSEGLARQPGLLPDLRHKLARITPTR